MNYKHTGYNRLLVGDLYHWEKDVYSNLEIKENAEVV